MWGSDDLKSLIQKQIPVIYKQIYEDSKSNEGILKFVVLYLFGGFYYLKDKNPIQIPENSHSELMVTDDYIYSARKYHPFLKYCIKGFLCRGESAFKFKDFVKLWKDMFPGDFSVDSNNLKD